MATELVLVQPHCQAVPVQSSEARKRNTGNNGVVLILPDAHALVTHMKDLRRQELAVTSAHMMQFLPLDHMAWIENYMATRKTGYQSLLRLLQHFAGRHGFSKQRIYRKKKTQDDLELTRLAFGKKFQEGVPGCRLGIGGSYVANSESHSYRMTALLTTNEFDDYSAGHYYAMQKKAWMNGSVWKYYLREVLSQSIENPSILLVDYFDSDMLARRANAS
ncbi:hypothetical protein H257_12639 [Aphanomyces astaci]|uniref:DDE-1 domain-containing protein n=1 Tax=Aphanomyces astaci TaxID=112090 RepID=W4FZS8_APHAT|nr:hypothetical protein H257_12639 [Aphanomyces astaci]ETV72163.1 hypothetical protein H257_12639 [Aphanomyces astaci]|eukprot:XP_009838231.1 hypothetical protein H257_12639 [Aphanomyces astaci]